MILAKKLANAVLWPMAVSQILMCKSTNEFGDKSHQVLIKVTQTASYCGGARPPDELLNELRTEKPLAGVDVFIRSGSVNNPEDKILIQGKSDRNGVVALNLPKGNFYMVFGNKKNRDFSDELIKTYEVKSENYSAVNKTCLEEWLKQPELLMEIKGQGDSFTVNWNQPCPWHAVPCTSYTGPLPP